MKTSIAGAACSRRAATFAVSPVTSCCPVTASPATISPVFTPMRASMRGPEGPLQLLVQAREGDLHVVRGADRAKRVVLMDLGQAEDGHDRIADELLDRARRAAAGWRS